MKKQLLFLFLILLTGLNVLAQSPIKKPTDDDNSKFTDVGNIRLAITNFGTFGSGFQNWPQKPSCEYPRGSGIEHLFYGGLWVGAFRSDNASGANRVGPFVTTGAVDASTVSNRGGGFEWTTPTGSLMVERSNLLTSRVFSPNAISHQDFVADFVDTNTKLSNGEIIVDHSPLGLGVHLETYAWDYPFADFFVIFNYTIKNVSNKYLDSVYVGLWGDPVVRNTNNTPPVPLTSAFFSKGGEGYSDSLKIAYEFDAGGDVGLTDSYFGFQYLGSNTPVDSVNFVTWQYKSTADPNFFSPQNEPDRYYKLRGYFGGINRYNYGINPSTIKQPSNRSIMLSVGAIKKIAPGDSVNLVFAMLCGKKYGTDPATLDNELQKKTLYSNAEWALRAYYGEDRNRNNILDPGEDIDGNGKITRYILPTPPVTPKVKVVPDVNKVTIYWDKRAESSVDPISGKKDFEGYKIYRTNAGYDLTKSQNDLAALVKLIEVDSIGNATGYNTGFNSVKLPAPVKFEGDTTSYWYKYEVTNLLNGWQYLFSVTAFDKGDAENSIDPLESSALTGIQRIVPGTPATSADNSEVGVYPNPYYGTAYWDGASERLRKIYFYNLPETAEIVIYTLAGDIVKKIHHDPSSNSSDIKWFQTYAKDGNQQFSGGEHAWDLITDNDQAIATGLYLYSVKDLKSGKVKTGKFLIVK